MHQDAGAVFTLQIVERCFCVGVRREGRSVYLWAGAAGCETLDLANRHAATCDAASQGQAFLGIGNGEECASVAGGEATFLEQILNGSFEFEKAHSIGDRGAIFAGAFGDLFLREVKFIDEALKGVRLLDGIEIFPLEIFDQRHLQSHVFGDVANDYRDAAETRLAARRASGAPRR